MSLDETLIQLDKERLSQMIVRASKNFDEIESKGFVDFTFPPHGWAGAIVVCTRVNTDIENVDLERALFPETVRRHISTYIDYNEDPYFRLEEGMQALKPIIREFLLTHAFV